MKLNLVRTSNSLPPGELGYAMEVRATGAENITTKIFVKRRTKLLNGTNSDSFISLATPTQLTSVAENAPNTGSTFFRDDNIRIVAQSAEYLDLFFNQLKAQLVTLLENLEAIEDPDNEVTYSVSPGPGVDQPKVADIYGLPDQLAKKADLVDGRVPLSQLPEGLTSSDPQSGDMSDAVTSVAGRTGVVVLTKSDVGLGNVDNVSDVNKPISTATQTALDLKAAASHVHTLSDITDAGGAAAFDVGTEAGTVAAGDDSRFTDARTPLSHTHEQSEVTGLVDALAAKSNSSHNHDAAYVPKQRYQTIFIPAGAMTPATTAGASAATKEAVTNKQTYDVFAFDGASVESVWFGIRMPDLWDLGTLKAVIHWTPDTSGSGAVVWGLSTVAVSNDDAIDATLGTEVTVADSVLVVGDFHTTSATAAMTVGGTPALGDMVFFKLRRITSDAGDTMTQDALLMGLTLQWRESNTEVSVW